MRSVGRRVSAWLVAAAVLVLAVPGGSALAAKAAADAIWSDVSESAIARSSQTRLIVPDRYRTVRLNRDAFDRALLSVPMETAVPLDRSTATLSLPMPDGSFGEFRIVESPIMAPELAKKYPQIQTWVAQGIDDPSATARLDMTPKGFHAQIISWQGTSYVDPYQPGDLQNYIAYRKNDYNSGKQMQCEVEGDPISPKEVADPSKRDQAVNISSGANLRTYRLAMAATGEYTQFHGGTVLDGLSGIVSTVNRVTGIYEREVSVRFELVPDEDKIIYTNAGSDPYTNSSSDLGANQSNINLEIGTANYDVGHLVGTGGGGVASLGVICTGSKARGLTGSGAPIGDAFDVDYVAHEMGHQFGGNHTFNGSGGSCSGGNRNGSTAYEPGSGITIQAYAGICGGDNTQANSEDYFHRVSLNEIINHTTVGSGGSCGVLTATGNAVPTVTTTPTHTIPQQTPFELTAAGNDGDGDPLTYLWEEFDLGAANAEGTLVDNGSRALFRSFAPTPSPSRVFPSWRYILNNANAVPATAPLPGTASPNYFTGELLASTNRTMNFRVTVRDNRAGGGGTNEANSAVTVSTTSGPFRVTAPNTAISWAAGSSQSVTWDVAGTTAAPVNAANVRITMSVDGGLTWPIELAASEANDGSASVTVPANVPASTQARVRVQAVGNVFFDVSNVNFTTTNANTAPTVTPSGTAVSIRQGGPSANANVASVADAEDANGTLAVSLSGVPDDLDVSVINNAGTVNLTAQAACTLVAPSGGSKVYPLQLTVADSLGGIASASVNVNVARNREPTLGNYGDIAVARSSSTPNAPSAGPTDPDDNFSGMSVSPSTLPGGGTISVAPNGTVTVDTSASTAFGTYAVRVQSEDDCGAVQIKDFDLTVASTEAVLEFDSATVLTDNGIIEPNECNQVEVTLRNIGTVTATAVSAVVSTSTPNVSISQGNTTFADIPAGQTRTSQVPIEVSTDAGLVCLTDIDFDIDLTFAGGTSPLNDAFSLQVGESTGGNYAFTASSGAVLPAGGTLVPSSSGDDVLVSVTVPAGFNFSVYGTAFAPGSVLRASSNGTLQMVASGGTNNYDAGTLPSDGSGPYPEVFPTTVPVLMPYWDDLITNTTGGGIYTQLVGTAPNRQWIIEWRGQHYSDTPPPGVNLDFAVIFHEGSSDFDFVYSKIGTGSGAGGANAGIGVQAATTGSLFTQYSLRTASVSVGTKLSATIPPPTCSIGPGTCSLGNVVVTETGGSTDLSEASPTPDTYSVVLTVAPSSDVTINISADADVSVLPTSLTFNPLSWNVPQAVTVTAINDNTVEGAHTGTVSHSATGGGYTGAAIADVVANITDNDSATYQFSSASSSVSEGVGSTNFDVSMTFTTDGTGPVELGAPISVPVSVGPASTATGGGVDYSLATVTVDIPVDGSTQTATVNVIDDSATEGDETVVLQLVGGETGGGAGQQAVVTEGSPIQHTLTIIDNDLSADLAISNTLLPGPVAAGAPVSFEVTINNLSGVQDVPTANFAFTVAPALNNPQWTCVADLGATCSASGSGLPSESVALNAGTGVMYTITAEVPPAASPGTLYLSTATISAGPPYSDPNSFNNTRTASAVVDDVAIFSDGFESP